MLKIRYPNGRIRQGILLALGDQKIRVVVQDDDDVAEYRLVSQRWVSEECEIVTIEFNEDSAPFAEVFPQGIMTPEFDRLADSRVM